MFWIFVAIVWVIAVGVGLWLVFHSYPDPDRIDVKRKAGPFRPAQPRIWRGHGLVQTERWRWEARLPLR